MLGEALQAGDTAEVTVRMADSGGRVLAEGAVTVSFWAPGDWSGDLSAPGPRGDPEAACAAEFRREARGWAAAVSTAGWPPGRHLAGARFSGPTRYGPGSGSAWAELVLRP